MRALQVLRYFEKLRITHLKQVRCMLNLSKQLVVLNDVKLSNLMGKFHFILIFQ